MVPYEHHCYLPILLKQFSLIPEILEWHCMKHSPVPLLCFKAVKQALAVHSEAVVHNDKVDTGQGIFTKFITVLYSEKHHIFYE